MSIKANITTSAIISKMIAQIDSENRLQVIRKFDSMRDIVYFFAERGYNRAFRLRSIYLKDNSGELPSVDSALSDAQKTGISSAVWGQQVSDAIGPYMIINQWISLLDSSKGKFTVDTEGWVAEGTNTIARIAEGDGALEVTFVDSDKGAKLNLNAAGDINTDLTVGKKYYVKVRAKRNAVGTPVQFRIHNGVSYYSIVELTDSYAWYYMYFTAQNATTCFMNFGSMAAGKVATVDEWDISEDPGEEWHGGSHLSPYADPPNSTWQEITAKTADSITLTDASDFPDPIDYQICAILNWGESAYSVLGFYNYIKIGNTLTVTSAIPDQAGVSPTLNTVVIGGDHPSQCAFVVPTTVPGTPIYKADGIVITPEKWIAAIEVTIETTNSISFYDTIDPVTHIGTEILSEYIKYTINQNSGNVYINLETVVKDLVNISIYYGSQLIDLLTLFATSKYYYAHSDDPSLLNSVVGTDSGMRATYPCEKLIYLRYGEAENNNVNMSGWVDLSYGTPSEDRDIDPYWVFYTNKVYFQNIGYFNGYLEGEKIKWNGGLNFFANDSTTEGVISYWQYEDALYYIVDFTDSLSFNHDETITVLAGCDVEVIFKDDTININDLSGDSFTIPSTGLSLTASGAGNIKLKISYKPYDDIKISGSVKIQEITGTVST